MPANPREKTGEIAREVLEAAWGTPILTRGARVVERPGWYQVLSPGSPGPSRNEVMHSVLPAADAERVIEETIAEYDAIGTPFKWCTSPFTEPRDMGARLERRGFGSWLTRGMYARVAELDFGPAPAGVTLEEVGEANKDEYVDAFLRGWILDREPNAIERGQLLEDLRWLGARRAGVARFYLARVDGEPAGTAGFHLKPRSGYLVGGNVLRRFRGRGVYRALLGARVDALRAAGRELAVTGARERTSAPILEALGFATAFKDAVHQRGGTLPE